MCVCVCTLDLLQVSPLVAIVTGEVFSWGSGVCGRLGHGNLRDRFSSTDDRSAPQGMGVTNIACHEFHSAAVCGEGHTHTLSFLHTCTHIHVLS